MESVLAHFLKLSASIVFVFLSTSLIAQYDFPNHPNVNWDSWVKIKSTGTQLEGRILGFNENDIYIRLHHNNERIRIMRSHISELKVRKHKNIWRTAKIGFWAGFGIGVIMESQREPDNLAEAIFPVGRMTASGLGYGVLGGIVGGAIGSLKIKIPF